MTFEDDSTRSLREHSMDSRVSDNGSRRGSRGSVISTHKFNATEAGGEMKAEQCAFDLTNSSIHKVCQMIPMVVQILLDILETRIPPIHNLRAGLKDKTTAEIAAMTENIRRNSAAGLGFAKQALEEHSTGTLLQVLRCYLMNNYPSLFEPTYQLCKLSSIFLYIPCIPTDNKRYFAIEEVAKVCEKMTTRRVMLLSLIMRKLHLWVEKQIAFEVTNNPNVSAEKIAHDAYSVLADLFVDCLIRVPTRIQMSLLDTGINIEEVESILETHEVEEPEKSSREESEAESDGSIYSATQYLKKQKSREYYKRLAMNIKLAKENARREAEKATAKMTQKPMTTTKGNLDINDFKAVPEAHSRPEIMSIQESVEVQEILLISDNASPKEPSCSQLPCKGPSIRITDAANNECGRICLDKEISWSVLMLLISAIGIDFWHKVALDVLTTKQHREKMRKGRGRKWRKFADLALLQMKK
ncbi:unnamed protein product [Hydatigera taeniaeformis]|uniref:Uncharacterized protein n=1 Tax=Hydatigena taeniaeformis TaxID=6205 RepID=A0A0R3X615_HYDTA|nr:unnamed protein product [Hydatigera taeniaeformis]